MYKLTLKILLKHLRQIKKVKIIKQEYKSATVVYEGFIFDALHDLDKQTLNAEVDTCDINYNRDTNLCFRILFREV